MDREQIVEILTLHVPCRCTEDYTERGLYDPACQHHDAIDAVDNIMAVLDLEQIGWRNDQGRMCFGHEHHHCLDGVAWCQPVYIKKSEAAAFNKATAPASVPLPYEGDKP